LTWACFLEIIRSSLGEMGERLTQRVASKVGFSLFLAFDFEVVTVDNPDSHKYVVVKGHINLIACFDRERYSLVASNQNEARSICESFRLLSADSSISSFSNTVDRAKSSEAGSTENGSKIQWFPLGMQR